MPRIFDNIGQHLLPSIRQTLHEAASADFCVGYFNLRGWGLIADQIDRWPGTEDGRCRVLVGMQRLPQEELESALSLLGQDKVIDNQRAFRLRQQLAGQFRKQLAIGIPTVGDETALRRLSDQLRTGKVVVKLFLRHPLHAKLYLIHLPHNHLNPIVGYLGSSNLTLAGLKGQGELNVDVLDHDACLKLQGWFNDRWADARCVDISAELAEIIDESWAREQPLSPYHAYVKMAWHLSREARAGLAEYAIPPEFAGQLFDYQVAAVKIAAHHLNKRGGVLIGDVVGLGKTIMASAVAKVFQDDHGTETLIICPKNLAPMWEGYVARYRLLAKVLPLSQVLTALPQLRRFRVVLIDESHNLRNREGKRFRAIQEYIEQNDSRCILLSATPYNKSYRDLSAQLRLFVAPDQDLGIRPEQQIRADGETEFIARHQCGLRTLAAFEHSEVADDWRELMRLFLVRRTRGFIMEHYTALNPERGRRYLTFGDGRRSYFPVRVPRTVPFAIDPRDRRDPYARLHAPAVVRAIDGLALPRYGLGNYVEPGSRPASTAERQALAGLSRAGKRLMGFCRTNLFKRLESGGPAFIQSLERHILRNFVFLHAIERGLDLPLGSQDADLLDAAAPDDTDDDIDAALALVAPPAGGPDPKAAATNGRLTTEADFRRRAAEVYAAYAGPQRKRFSWLRPALFQPALAADLLADAIGLLGVLQRCGEWRPDRDAKLAALLDLLIARHPTEKVLVFTQFADTVDYLVAQLAARGVSGVAGVTGDSDDPTELARRFSPVSNECRDRVAVSQELRVLVATDVLSEGQNLQDCAIIVNYDLPWAIVRLIQRAGRIDRIGQAAADILCYSFLPAEGVERIINLRGKVRRRLRENAEVVGTDEAFFEDEDTTGQPSLRDLYNERAGILDGDADTEVDLASYAYQIWQNAVADNPGLARTIPALPEVVYATREYRGLPGEPEGVLLYLRTADDNDALAWIDREGRPVTQSQLAILKAAACAPETPARARNERHHELVRDGVAHLLSEERALGGGLGRPSGARFRTYERLKRYEAANQGTLFIHPDLRKAIDEIYRLPLRQSAIDTLNRQLKSGIDDQQLVELVVSLRNDDRLCMAQQDEGRDREPRIVCSLGLFAPPG
jgi:hypothetical protein